MSYCLNPDCQKPVNLDNARFCQSCASKLWLKDRYRVTQPLGKGGFGKTFLAVDEQNRISCVIKQLLPEHQGNLKVKELFEREATQLAELGTHPQIPTWFDNFEQGLEKAGQQTNLSNQKYLYIVLELIEGKDLLKELEQSGKFNEKKIRKFLKDILPVLKFIHDKNVIHRDIKPDNIMRQNSDGKLVLIDFGGVKEFTQTNMGKTGLTGLHTPGYAPNEQIRGKVYPASDLYCLGATCIHLLTGIHPFNIYDALEDRLMWREALAKGRITISPHLIQVLDKLLKESVKERYQSADEVYRELFPKVKLSESILDFAAQRINQEMSQTITVINSKPETQLEGEWEAVLCSSKPPYRPDSHTWISVYPAKFSGNRVNCTIRVDTSKLRADNTYIRTIILRNNSYEKEEKLTIRVKTAPLPIQINKPPLLWLTLLLIVSLFSPVSINFATNMFGQIIKNNDYFYSQIKTNYDYLHDQMLVNYQNLNEEIKKIWDWR